MKTTFFLLALVSIGFNYLPAQESQTGSSPPAATGASMGYEVVQRDANSRVWARVNYATNELGEVTASTNTYTELATSMYFLRGGEWVASTPDISLLAEGAAATNTAHCVFFPANVNSGVVTLISPDARQFRSRVLGLSLFDGTNAVLIAENRDSIGQLVLPNRVVYTNAFDNDDGVEADVEYLVTIAGLEQNVVLRRLPAPEEFGLGGDVRLELLTEFYEAPIPAKRISAGRNGLVDESLDFGNMQMGPGRGFAVGDLAQDGNAIKIYKQWTVMDGRTFLIEEVPFKLVAKEIQISATNQPGASLNRRRQGTGETVIAALKAVLPTLAAKPSTGKMRLAKSEPERPGFVLDYALLTSQPNFTFQGDTTYYVTNTVNLSGTATIEGGTVVKVATNTAAKINFTGTVVCQTGPFRPALFLAKDDDTAGETISGSTGTPTNYYGGGLVVNSPGSALHDLRFSYAYKGVVLGFESGEISLANLQCVNCQYPIYSGHDFNTIIVDNCLFDSGSYVVFGGSGSDLVIIGRHLTVHGYDKVGPHTSDLTLTNSVVVGTPWGSGSVTTDSTVHYTTDPGGIFQTVGAASHYLAEGSTNRDAGTTDIPASVLADLQRKTTYPPSEITTNITGDTVLSAQGLCDTNTPDLGYHYDPLDYVVSGRTVSANLTLTNGVALGTYGASSSYGLGLNSGSFVSKGTPTNLNWIVRYNTVQEQSTTSWSASSVAPGAKMLSSSPVVSVRFTGWSLLAGVGDHFYGYASATTPCGFTDCQFGGGAFTMVDNSTTLTNCLWERVALTIDDDHDPMEFAAFNNLLRGGSLALTLDKNSNEWFLKDNLFDETTITTQGAGTITHDYNGYVFNCDRLPSNGAHDVILTNSPVFQSGARGGYYYPTNDGMLSTLIDAGSRPVEDAGLAGFTVQTNQAPDLCTVDIGFHYRGASGDLVVSTNCTALDLVKLLVPVAAWGSIANASYTGMVQARGVFTNGFLTGFPINYGVILASGDITNAIGTNYLSDAMTRFWLSGDEYHYNDSDLDSLVAAGGYTTEDAAVLEFDLTSTTSFTLQFRYIFGSEEYPEWIDQFNDPVAIFVTTNFDGTKWVNNVTNDLAVVPGMTNVPVSVNNINGGYTWYDTYVSPTNAQYYVDNCDPYCLAATNAAPVPVFNLQYDGFTTLQTVQTNISAYVTYHIKIAIADYHDDKLDSGVFIKAQCQ